MKMNQEELRGRVKTCVNFLTRALDKNNLESENQKFPERYWWPQDMLPFEISKAFGEGWMLIAEPISNKETSVFAIQTSEPEQLKKRTNIVLQSLDTLKTNGSVQIVENQLEKLQSELAEKDLLIKEMNHRAKNNLSLAASFVKMQAGFSDDANSTSILRQTQKRLETLASLHELMYMSPGNNGLVDIKDYLTKLAVGLVNSFGNTNIQLELQIDQAMVEMKMANTLGLLVNELISNSFKHAFKGAEAGVLKLHFLEKDEYFKLRVSDNGPGFSEKETGKTSLGNILIDEFVKQLHGKMEIDTTVGTTYLISIKKSILGI
jgi:two-component sensor histidine kinase